MVSSTNAIRQNAVNIYFLGKLMDGYLECYNRVSHSVVIPPGSNEPIDLAGPSSNGGNSNDIPLLPPPLGMNDRYQIHMINLHYDSLMGLVKPDGEIYALAS